LRADNADQRLTPTGRAIGCVGDRRWASFSRKVDALDNVRRRLADQSHTARAIAALGINVNPDKESRSGLEILALSDSSFHHLCLLDPSLADVPPEIQEQIKSDALYAHYVVRQARDVEALRRDEAQAIPVDLDYLAIPGLSTELKQKLTAIRPATIAQAAQVDGMTPSALLLISARVRQTSDTVRGLTA